MRARLSDPVPLRHTTVWPGYTEDAVIPRVYGRTRVPGRKYAAHGKTYVLADHALAGVDAVYDGDDPVVGWQLRNGADMTGHACAFLDLAEAPTGELSADVRGLDGAPAAILNDLYPRSDLGDLAIWAAQQGIELGGALIDDLTVRAALQLVCDQFGGAWSAGMPGFAGPFPPSDSDPTWAEFAPLDRGETRAECTLETLENRLTVRYAWDYAKNQPRQSLVVEATSSVAWFGTREKTLDLPWIGTARAALAVATRRLHWRARPLWTLQFTAGPNARTVPPCGWIQLTGSDVPVTGRAVVLDVDPGYGSGSVKFTVQIPAGDAPAVSVIQSSAAF